MNANEISFHQSSNEVNVSNNIPILQINKAVISNSNNYMMQVLACNTGCKHFQSEILQFYTYKHTGKCHLH